ncbi:MAG: aromatic amino acid ammonia-lyase [Proteobacteria bacterium]|nr:aromatic amino acid ammonia-lyase [Pseudomonadota bacterium]
MAVSPTQAEPMQTPPIAVGRRPLGLEDVLAAARGERLLVLDDDPDYRRHLEAGPRWLAQHQAEGNEVYGVTTGVGASVENAIPPALRDAMPLHLLRFHGCGTGRILEDEEAAAVVVVRLASLARGYSGVRPALLERLCELVNRRVLPRIPAQGSVGASGDLTPLSYLAATLVGEREVSFEGRVESARDALAACGLEPLALRPKESLAIMNGTSVMTALAVLAFDRARRLGRWACRLAAGASFAAAGNPAHFDDRIFELKPHPGQREAARCIREDLAGAEGPPPARLQDRYSIRCAPHVIGVLLDALRLTRGFLETEINGVNDNPIIDPVEGGVLHGGNFYGGHVAFVMDGLKTAVAGVADLLDRQLQLLCVSETSGGLPANLVAGDGAARVVHHGFKAMQIGTSALAAEAQKLTMPAAAFSRSTESHNQDKVSMGTIAARDCLRVLELTETTAAMQTLAVCQAIELRSENPPPPRLRALSETVRADIPMVTEDRRQDGDIEHVLSLHRRGRLPLGELDSASAPDA